MKYRSDIDGLRALAVLPVIIFHAGFTLFSGGYVGVDVFFVISGYLITSILFAELEEKRFSIVKFYERRARRILPALFCVLLVTIPFAWWVLLPSDMIDFAQSLVAVSAFSSNFLFWRETGYFAAASELKPLLHTWSLAIEEQYYFIFPLALAFLWRSSFRSVVGVLALVFFASLSLGHWASINKPDAAFFLLPTRAWELLVGVFCALILRYVKSEIFTENHKLANAASALGIALIIYSIFVFDDTVPFPGLPALVPTLGAGLIIVFSRAGTVTYQILSLKPFVWIGLVSYSAYLWHQPVMALVRYQSPTKPSQLVMAGLCILTFALAYLSWRFVEHPFRNKSAIGPRKIFAFSAVFILAPLAAGAIFLVSPQLQSIFEKKFTQQELATLSLLDYVGTPEQIAFYREGACFLTSDHPSMDSFDKEACLSPSDQGRNILLLGNSHAAHWSGALRQLPDTTILQATSSGCTFTTAFVGQSRCVDLAEYVYHDSLPKMPTLDAIVLSSRWQEDDLAALPDTISLLKEFSDQVVLVGPTVEYSKPLPELLVRLGMTESPSISTHYTVHERMDLNAKMKKMADDLGFSYVDLIGSLCGDQACVSLTKDGAPMAFDYGHFTKAGALEAMRMSGLQSMLIP